MFSPSGRI